MTRLLSFAVLSLFCFAANAADRIASAEAALDRLRTACENEIKQAVSPETMSRINHLRGAPSLTIRRKAPQDFAALNDPKSLAQASRNDLYGSRKTVLNSKSETWVLTYDQMKGLTVYLDAPSGSVLCVAFIPEG
jgi:hypothetical protein